MNFATLSLIALSAAAPTDTQGAAPQKSGKWLYPGMGMYGYGFMNPWMRMRYGMYGYPGYFW